MGGAQRGGQELDVRLLGPLELSNEGRTVTIGGPKPRALLASLALEAGRVVSVDRLVESLWPGDPPDTAGHAVQVYVSQLRKALGNDAISTRPPGYVLELEPVRVDVHLFARLVSEGRETLGAGDPATASSTLRDALALWRGPALADFTYEPFAQTDIARLEELRVVALEERIEADLALGRQAELVSELEAVVEAQPLRERPRAQLMLALYRSGRQADALGEYRNARDILVEELGIEPGPELRKLEAAILRQDEALLPPEGQAAPAMQFRRLVTVLFVDVVESMALAEALDAEALGRVLSGYFESVSAALTRHGGTIEKYAGDAVMAVFGIPVSHEDDALRAARAALDVRSAVAELNGRLVERHGVGLEIRIGLESGEVVTTPAETRQRLVAGEAVGIASRLEEAAAADEIVVGELAGRLIDHAARLEPLGEIEIKGRREPVRAFRLRELEEAPPAFGRRLDAKLVGRKRELAALRSSLKRAVETSAAQVALVTGPPGVGKSRLALELTQRVRGATVLHGRCLSYGEGITYWPLREVVARASPGEERDAVLAALDADTSPPAAEIAWVFRRLCAALAQAKPLLLVFDDLHWAEPTFLELIEQVADRGEGPILVVCLARDDLREERPALLEGTNAEEIRLDALSPEETEALLDGLGGAVLESDQRVRVAEAAEGNPFFLEQLLALALEGGLTDRALPETVQALLAARLDRLGPGERAVLERGAVVGKEFGADAVTFLLDPAAASTAAAHLRTLSERGFVRPRGEQAFGFRHVLVQEAVYRAAPKRLRAELHERFAERLDATAQELPDLDELAGYHLEQAHRLRVELGDPGELAAALATEAGLRLGAAGMRAFRRGDVPAALNLLGRATSLLPPEEPQRRELRCNLAILHSTAHDLDGAAALLRDVVAEAQEAEDDRIAAWARIELEYLRVRGQGRTADDLLAATEAALPIFERAGDHRALGRAWLFAGWVHGGHRSDHAAWADAAERALAHYRAAKWPASSCVGELASALYWGATPVDDAVARCEELLREEERDRIGSAYLTTFLGGLVAQQGDFDRGRALVASARDTLEELGHRGAVTAYCGTVLGEIELLAGDAKAAERVLREVCDDLARRHDFSQLASRASDLAEALLLQVRLDEAEEWTRTAIEHAAADDVNAQMMSRSVGARLLALRGELERAEELALEGVRLTAATDDLNRRAEAERDLGEVLRLAGKAPEAAAAFDRAIALFEQKGNVAGTAQIRRLQDVALV